MSVAEQVESFSRDLPRVFAGVIQPVLVGAGGRAHVFRVERPSPISPDTRETVAIKVFGLHALAPAEVERHFESEKKALARLRRLTDGSDDVRVMRLVRFHETLRGTWRDRPVFAFVGEYFRDGTLSRWRQQRDRVSLPQLQSLLRDIADALQFLHERGEVHQDVKPDNIFVVETDHAPDAPDRPRARIGDFGCTRPDGVLTESRTPLFAPDIGEPLDSGGRYDVFALGCVLAFLIKGKLEVADRRFGRMSPLVLEPARARAVVVGADDRWYRDATALLQDATRQDPARRPDARQLADRFDRICEANQRRADRRAARGAMWRDAVIPMWPSWAAIALLVVLTIVAAIARDARSWMPAGAETWSDDVIGVWRAADSRLLLADSR
ncbi:MAG: protein kinase, partial [Planctomycetota bacterium]